MRAPRPPHEFRLYRPGPRDGHLRRPLPGPVESRIRLLCEGVPAVTDPSMGSASASNPEASLPRGCSRVPSSIRWPRCAGTPRAPRWRFRCTVAGSEIRSGHRRPDGVQAVVLTGVTIVDPPVSVPVFRCHLDGVPPRTGKWPIQFSRKIPRNLSVNNKGGSGGVVLGATHKPYVDISNPVVRSAGLLARNSDIHQDVLHPEGTRRRDAADPAPIPSGDHRAAGTGCRPRGQTTIGAR